jgi:hypothetical protein
LAENINGYAGADVRVSADGSWRAAFRPPRAVETSRLETFADGVFVIAA